MNWKAYLLVGLLVLSFAGYIAHSLKESGALEAKLERAEADREASVEREKKVTADLEESGRELRKLKEMRHAATDRINKVADPTGCLDAVLDGTDFAVELRRAYGDAVHP